MNDQNTNITNDCGGGTCEVADTHHKAQPAYHVAEHDSGVAIHVALPGVSKENLTLSTTGNILTLSAERSDRVPEDWKTHHGAERPDLYELKVRLNRSLDPGKVTAALRNGVLHLEIAQREEAKPRQISVH